MKFNKNKTRMWLAVVLMSFSINNLAYADEIEKGPGVNTEYTEEDTSTLPKIAGVSVVSIIDEKLINKVWVQDYNKKWKYVNGYGEAQYGLFADEKGDIYYGGYDGYIYTNKLDEHRQYFGSDGRLVNLGAYLINDNKAKKYADMLDRGEIVQVDYDYDVKGFLEYYLGQDYIYIQPAFVTQDRRSGNKVKLKLYDTPTYTREDVEKAIDNLIGSINLDNKTDTEKVTLLASAIKDNMTYDAAYSSTDIITCINDRRGCCRHYACMIAYLLNKNGIYAEEVSGETLGPHSWVKAFYEDRWHYIDISAYVETHNSIFLDLDYQFYIENYKTTERLHNKALK